MMQSIKSEFQQWIESQLGNKDFTLHPLKGDASFRSYYRLKTDNNSLMLMVAPPATERTDAFVNIAQAWKESGLLVPSIYGWEPKEGLVLLSDFGDVLLADALSDETVDSLYQKAMQTIQQVQAATLPLPSFDQSHIRSELQLFYEWFLNRLLQIELTFSEQKMLEEVVEHLVKNCLIQPQVPIHRDYHSRNLMLLNQNDLGVIDFQDAMQGPITYDLVSLLKDCYVAWPQDKVSQWVKDFYASLKLEKNIVADFPLFSTWFDWTGLQRHLKVMGIFSRLKLRDNKPNYIADMPRIMNYILEVTKRYPEFAHFDDWLRSQVLPPLTEVWQQHPTPLNIKVA